MAIPGTDLNSGTNAGKILLVEDESSIRKLISEMLRMEGLEVVAFANGLDGLEWIKTHSENIPLVITDIRMPGISGKELADQICRIRPHTKILFLSGYSPYPSNELNSCSHSEMAFLAKPFRKSELITLIEGILGSPTDKPHP